MSEVSEIKVEWTPQNSGRVSSIQIQSRIRGQYTGAEEGWTEQAAAHDPTAGSFTFSSNAPGTEVEVRARYRMTSGVYGAWFQDGIRTARVTIPYVDLTGTPSRLSDINPGEGGKLGGIAPGADVTRDNTAKDTSNVSGRPSSTIVAGIDKLPTIRVDIDKALAAGQAVADREIAAATPPGSLSNIQWFSTLTDAGADVTLTWTAAKDATSYEVELSENGGGAIVFAAPATSYRFAGKRNTSYSSRIRALKINVASGWVSAPSFATGRDTVAPAAPTGLSAVGGITWIDVATVAPSDSDQAKIRFTLYRSDNAKIAEATVSATANTRAETRFSNLARAAAYYVAAVALDSSDNVSATTANVPVATTGGVSLDDLTPGLVPPQTVTSLPSPSGWTGSPVVFYAGELYRLSGGGWTKSVSGQDIAPSTISTEKLVNSAITADKLAMGSVTETRLADFSVANVKLAPNSVDAYKIIDGAVGNTKIATAAITEVKIADDAISAPKIQANAITADKIAANTIVARNLAIGNFDNIIPDGGFFDPGFWNGKNFSGGYGNNTVTVRPQNSQWRFDRTIYIDPTDAAWYTPFFTVEIGATYKLDYQIYMSPDFNGWLNISLHMPGLYWLGIRKGFAGIDPTANYSGDSHTFHRGDTNFNPAPVIFSIPSEASNLTRNTQFRFDGHWTTGYVEFMVRIVRVSDATLIKDGAITTDKITAGAINADKVSAGAIQTRHLSAATKPISLVGCNIRYQDGAVRWDSGYILFTNANGDFVSRPISANSINGGASASSPMFIQYYMPDERTWLDYNNDATYFASPNWRQIAIWYGGSNLAVHAGVGTILNGDQIVTGSINANKLTARTIEAGHIRAGTISGYELAANTISTNNLVVASRPVSMSGINMRITTDGVLRWDAGNVRIVNTVGSTDTYNISGGETGSHDCMVVYVPGRSYFDVVGDRNFFLPNSEHIKIADRFNGSLNVYAGVSTIINGERIVTGSINANKIVARTISADRLAANSITANEILTGTITAAQIATSALTARVLAVGNPDNVIGDGGYNDPAWWNGGNADNRLSVGESGMNETGRELKITSSGRTDYYSMFFPVELGATYRVSVGVYTYGDFSGNFRPVIHMPAWAWLSLKTGYGINPEDANPAVNWNAASSYFRNEFTITNPANTLACKQWQFRLIGDWSGTLAFTCKIVRVSDTTLIKDGAITTDKITVNSLNGDRITAGTLSAEKIAANSVISNTVTVANTSGNLGDAVERARDPAYRINNGVGTQINPGLINISGGTTLANWRQGGDDTRIAGGSISANTISANKLTIGNRAISFIGLNFEWNPANNWVSWSNGYIYYQDDNGSPRAQFVNPGNTGGANPHRFFYWVKDGGYIYHTQSEQEAFGGSDRVMLGSWWGGSDLNMTYGGTIINGDRITTGSIDANRIKANTILANTVIVGGRGTVDSAFDSAKWSGVSGAGKPQTFTVGARGNRTSSLPSGYNHGLRGPDGQVYWDGSYPNLRTDAYNRSYTVCWTNGGEVWGIRHFDVYGNGTVAYEGGYGSSAGSMAQLLRDISFGSTIVIYTSDEPSGNRLNEGLAAEMYNCGASRSVFGSSNFPAWSSYILIGQKGVGEGNGTEYFSAGGPSSYVRATFSIVNGVPSIGGASIKDARDLAFSDGRGVDVLRGVAEGATVGAPSGTMVGNTEAQTVTNWAYTGQQDPAGRINRGETTTINGGRITTGSVTANQIAANTITADRLNVTSLSALSANIGDVTAGVVRNASGSAKFDLNAGRIIFDNGSVMKVSGNGFGSSGQFIEWFGPRKANLADCTEANASYYLKTDGSSYFGGSLSAGTTKNAIGTTSTATNANVTTGSVGSRGGTRVVVLSYSWSWSQSVDKFQNEGSGSDLSAQIVLSRNGADVATLTATGSWYRDPAFSADEPGSYREGIGGSLTFTDNSGGSTVTYSARLTSRNTGPGPQNGSTRGGIATQNISIVQTEQ
ncbi:hypothetical protein [Sphingomonas sp. Leaf257]|uniref:hypothetical protein n=1 Tax=Sphingomonas sp. Leaf257 TaxID=1736309 RepID=UPI00144460A4|nr:hypothetical protein [Sphingomonas sp. Leaf257]